MIHGVDGFCHHAAFANAAGSNKEHVRPIGCAFHLVVKAAAGKELVDPIGLDLTARLVVDRKQKPGKTKCHPSVGHTPPDLVDIFCFSLHLIN